jgi:hypothetical protein
VGSGHPQRRADRGQPALQLGQEEHVGQLRGGVRRVGPVGPAFPHQVVGVEVAAVVRARGDHDHAVGDPRQQQVGEREVAEVVGRQLQLEAVGAAGARQAEDARVVDEHVDLAGCPREGADRGQVGHVEQAYVDVAVQLCRRLLAPLLAAHGERDASAALGEHPGRLEPDAAAGTSDDVPPAVLRGHRAPAAGAHRSTGPAT